MDKYFPTFRRHVAQLAHLPFWRGSTSRAQRRSLLRLIVAATEENLPLSDLIEAWAADETGNQSVRLSRLAERLRAGTSLPDAIEEVRGVLSEDDILAIRFGIQSGTLAETIRDVLDNSDEALVRRSSHWWDTMIYASIFATVAVAVVAFLQIKIIPTLRSIFYEFDMEPPGALEWSVWLTDRFVNYWYLFALAIIAAWLVVFSSVGRKLRLSVFGTLIRPLRELRWADVLQKLSIVTRAGRPLPGALSTLARYHYDPALRRQLLYIRNEIEHGADIWQSLAKLGVLNEPEVHALETAEQIGNRSWVLNQLALLKKRRIRRRLSKWSEIALPVAVIVMGAFVLLQALSIFGSLARIIASLSV